MAEEFRSEMIESDGVTTSDPIDEDVVNSDDVPVTEVTPEPVSDDTPDSFPRKYVEDLRRESAGYRDRAKDRDDIAARLHTALVAATGRLQDATDLPFDEAHLSDSDALTAALDDLLAKKPHLGKVSGSIGQGVSQASANVSLTELLRQGA